MQSDIKKIKYKIFFLFLIPAVVMLFFTFHFVYNTNATLQKINDEKISLQKLTTVLELIHSLQIERGLCAGYISDANPLDKQKILQARKKTDIAIQNIDPRYREMLEGLDQARTKIFSDNISLHEEVDYYTQIINKLIGLVKYLLPKIDLYRYDTLFLTDIEMLKEAAGLERACVYSQLITETRNRSCTEMVLIKQQQQDTIEQNIFFYSQPATLKIYQKHMREIDQQEINELRKLFKAQLLSKEMASYWFRIASHRIDSLNAISLEITNNITNSLEEIYNKQHMKLNIAVLLWVLSITAALYFFYILEKIFQKHTYFVDQLTLASHTFDSYEGIVITDPQTRVIKANNGFERITGYSFQEIEGEKISILKSGKHPDDFYKKMWQSILETGTWSGEIYNKHKNGKIYNQRLSISTVKSGDTVQYYVGHLFDITSLVEAQQKAHYQATHDYLTNLINRKELIHIMKNELIRAKRQGFVDAFLFIDLDNFKDVNDSYGHHTGDAVLQHIASTLTASVREGDIVARISGDEFAVVLLDLKSGMQAHEKTVSDICMKILQNIHKPITLENVSLTLSVSIGVRLFPLNLVDTVDAIIRDADFAMYEAKSEGKNHFTLFQS